jgi:bifunctional non-homologous end joining protein LigD
VRDGIRQVKLTGFLKTIGGKGLHLVVPFKKGPSWDEAKGFARTYSEAIAKAAPGRFTTNIRKAARTGKIFIDYLRNGEAPVPSPPIRPAPAKEPRSRFRSIGKS